MDITLNIMKELLGYEFEQSSVAENPAFQSIELLNPDSEVPEKATLYISTLSEALSYNRCGKKIYFLCVRDRISDEIETETSMSEILVVKKNIKLNELFNSAQRILLRLFAWQYEMQRAIANNHGIQTLLTLSESVIGNYITVLDAAFKVTAATYGTEVPNYIAKEVVELGYMPPETVKQLNHNRQYEVFNEEDNLIINTTSISDSVAVVKQFKIKGVKLAFAMMACNKKYSNGIIDLFQILVRYIGTCLEKEYQEKHINGPITTFLEDLLEGKMSSISEAKDRASYIGLPFHGSYNLFLIRCPPHESILIYKIALNLNNWLKDSDVVTRKNEILILNRNSSRTDGLSATIQKLQNIKSLLREIEFSCGISNTFSSLNELPIAYDQALTAVHFGEYFAAQHIEKTLLVPGMPAYYFEDYALDYQIYISKAHSLGLIDNSMTTRLVSAMEEMETLYHVPYAHIVEVFLLNERRATISGELLHMHRNTVLYHVKKVEEHLNISLEDPSTRLKLLIGFIKRRLEMFSWHLSTENDRN